MAMKYPMRYAFFELGEQDAESTAVVRLRGKAANVVLVDELNFGRYRTGQPFSYVGGRRRRGEIRLAIPRDGRWYVVLDLGGYSGRTKGTVTVLGPDGSKVDVETREALTESG
jgi:hypothetical protein